MKGTCIQECTHTFSTGEKRFSYTYIGHSKTRRHCQGYVEAVVEGTGVSVGLRRHNNPASMYVSTSSLDIIDSMFALSANEHNAGQSGQNFYRTLYVYT